MKLLNKVGMNSFASNNPDELWDIMLAKINDVAKNMCPIKEFKIKRYRDPWISPEILEMIKDKDRASKKAIRTNSEADWIIARRLRNSCLSCVRKAKGDLIRNELNTNCSIVIVLLVFALCNNETFQVLLYKVLL